MEPLDEKELKGLLREWKAPDAPPSLERRVLLDPEPWWNWIMTGSIRIPVPFGIAAVLAAMVWLFYSRPVKVSPRAPGGAAAVSLVDFQPVQKLEPVIVAGGQQ